MLADRTTRISSSPTMKGLLAAERLRQAGVDVVDLSAGEPDFPTPTNIKDATKKALDDNFTRYTAAGGECDDIDAARLELGGFGRHGHSGGFTDPRRAF